MNDFDKYRLQSKNLIGNIQKEILSINIFLVRELDFSSETHYTKTTTFSSLGLCICCREVFWFPCFNVWLFSKFSLVLLGSLLLHWDFQHRPGLTNTIFLLSHLLGLYELVLPHLILLDAILLLSAYSCAFLRKTSSLLKIIQRISKCEIWLSSSNPVLRL